MDQVKPIQTSPVLTLRPPSIIYCPSFLLFIVIVIVDKFTDALKGQEKGSRRGTDAGRRRRTEGVGQQRGMKEEAGISSLSRNQQGRNKGVKSEEEEEEEEENSERRRRSNKSREQGRSRSRQQKKRGDAAAISPQKEKERKEEKESEGKESDG